MCIHHGLFVLKALRYSGGGDCLASYGCLSRMDIEARKPEFVKLQRDLDKTLSKLRKTRDPNARRELLREMRLLLLEADRILDSPTQP